MATSITMDHQELAVDKQNHFDLDCSFTSTASTSSFFTTTTTTSSSSSSSSARSSLSLSLPSFSSSTSSVVTPLPHSRSRSSSLWSALHTASALSSSGALHLRHLRLLRPLGSGHLARVFHCRLLGSDSHDFALKVIDLDNYSNGSGSISSTSNNKLSYVMTESRVLASLDHPFLPTLYARIDASHYACFLIDYCPGGDLHSLLVRHPSHRLPLSAVRFFAAEVLLALEYLHALGFVYRDLKPENVLIRSDGHIMLSDFDLCFSSSDNNAAPSVFRRRVPRRRKKQWLGCCRIINNGRRNKEEKFEEEMEIVSEPTAAFSRACVGTHEYLAPEIVAGAGHGSGVDWWAFGVFLYELLYGRTPFKGNTKEETLKNIVTASKEVGFPSGDDHDACARDLIRRLLARDPMERLGSRRGASELKRHPFFQGVRWQLMRNEKSPVAVGPSGAVVVKEGRRGGWWWSRMLIKGKKGIIKLGLMGNSSSSSNNNKSKRRVKARVN